MKVLFNVKITDIRMGYPYRRAAWMPNPERYDVFRYCLASTAVLEPLVSKFVFCVTLAPELADRQQELEAYMRELFPADKLELIWSRCDYGRDWKRICDKYLDDPDEIVWLACNDDHIFIDSNLDMVESAINWLDLDPDPNAVMYLVRGTGGGEYVLTTGGNTTSQPFLPLTAIPTGMSAVGTWGIEVIDNNVSNTFNTKLPLFACIDNAYTT